MTTTGRGGSLVLSLLLLTSAGLTAELRVTDQVLRPAAKVPPLGANNWGGCGAVEWAANNFVRNSGNEPVYWRNLHRVTKAGPNWFEIDGGGTSWYDLWASGFLSGADLRLYRIVDKASQALPLVNNEPDMNQADHVVLLAKTRVLPEGTPGFPDGGWLCTTYGDVFPNAWIRHGNLTCTDASGLTNGRQYWYTVVAVSADGQESEFAPEVSATPTAGADTPPHLLVARTEDRPLMARKGQWFELAPQVVGGTAPYQWALSDEQGAAVALPAGVQFDPATGHLSGTPGADMPSQRLLLRVTDAKGRSDTRAYVFNAAPPTGDAAAKAKPQPPSGVHAVAGDGCVTLSWQPSPSANVVAYRLKRSTAPLAEQVRRVYVPADTPALQRGDYAVVSRRFDPFEMRWVHPRVRGIGNPFDSPAWNWNFDAAKTALALVAHPQPVPAAMVDPGETCLQVKAGPGEQSLNQIVMIGTDMGGESIWYGQLEEGKRYHLSVWLRQEGLANNGAVTFSYSRNQYPGVKQTFNVTGEWQEYTYDFTGGPPPVKEWHYGHQFTFSGPGTLWLDNCRISRVDDPADAAKPYVPDRRVLDELLASQPATGPKGVHRIWFLNRDATMASLTSWHANSHVNVDWRTSVEGTMQMTLPMALEFDRLTGDRPATRMRPWLVLQHLTHPEEDWRGLIEYLAAPYDPAKDTPEKKPWAYKRFQQRGTGTPWTDEFTQITIEFGNETWHNGVFSDWLGFSWRNFVHQGGPAYGMFCHYLIGQMQQSPYWQSEKLADKLRFDLGANYDGRVEADGRVRGYGEEAMQRCPEATLLGHANYVGPKWETGDKSAATFDDHGVQETLLAFLTGCDANQQRMGQVRDHFAQQGHDYDLGAYEGGPSGFAIPGRDTPQTKETNEHYGKSLAMAVAAFDGWMRSYQYGWTDQCYFSYGQGMYWNSHTWFSAGFRPAPGWLAMTLRNRYAGGDLMQVEENDVPTLQRGKDTLPLVGGYALRDGNRWAVFTVSRKLDGQHDGQDFGDGTTPVTLRLPFASAQKITLHALTGDPRQTNREAMNLQLQSRDIPTSALRDGVLTINEVTGGKSGGLPPGSILLYVFEGAR